MSVGNRAFYVAEAGDRDDTLFGGGYGAAFMDRHIIIRRSNTYE